MIGKFPGAGGLASLPDIIETAEEGPVLLAGLLGLSAASCDASDGLHIVDIDGCSAQSSALTELPGVRVGEGLGSGYIFRRALDGELVYAPDAGYTGLTNFNYTVADAEGASVTLLATVSVHRAIECDAGHIMFADGSHRVTVPEGIDAAILGALVIDGVLPGEPLQFRVFEGDAEAPSNRFVVSSDKLSVLAPLDQTDSTVQLKIVAYDADEQAIAASNLVVDVGQARSTGAATPGATPDWPARMASFNQQLDALAQMDQFHFDVVSASSEASDDEEYQLRTATETAPYAGTMTSGAAKAPPAADVARPEDPPSSPVDTSDPFGL